MSVEKAVGAGAWSAVDVVLRQALQFAISVALARLLRPEEFGIFAIVALFTSLAGTLTQGGLTFALIQRHDTSIDQESTVFWLNLIVSAAFFLSLLAVGPSVGRFFDQPVLGPLLIAAAAQIVLSALTSVQTALLTRELKFVALAKAGAASTFGSGALAIFAATQGAGVWALAVQLTSMAAINSAAIWLMSRWRPRLHMRLGDVRELWSFGGPYALSATLEILFAQSFTLVIGKLFGVRDLGLFTRASGTQALPSSILMLTISRVAMPMFAARKDDPDALRRGLRMSQSWGMLISLPMMIGLSILAELVLFCLLGPKWLDAAPYLSILAIAGVLTPMHTLNIQLLLGLGQSRTFLKLGLQKMALSIVCLVLGARWGLAGVSWAMAATSFLGLAINIVPINKAIDYGFWRQFWDLRGVAFATGVMAGAILLVKPHLHLSPWANLACLIAFGAAVYTATGFAARLHSFREAWGTLSTIVGARIKSRSAVPTS